MNAAVIRTWKSMTEIDICDGWGQVRSVNESVSNSS